MDLRQLEYFLAIVEEHNITKAAEKLHISQPPLSRALMDLEEELGCTLLIRGKRRITLTEEGQALKRKSEQILSLVSMTKSEITEMKNGISGTLYLGHVDSNGPTLAAEWIESFRKNYPLVTYNLWCGNADDLADRMKSGLLDLAITMTPVNNELLDSIVVFRENWVALIPASHQLAKTPGKKINIKSLVENELIISSRRSREEEIREWFKGTGKEPHFIVKVAHSSNAAKLVAANIGIALFPASVAGNIPSGTDLVIKEISPAVTVDYLLSWDKEKPLNPLAVKFVEHVRGLYKENTSFFIQKN